MRARLRRRAAVAGVLAGLLTTVACTGGDSGGSGGSDGSDGSNKATPPASETPEAVEQPGDPVLGQGAGLRRYYDQDVDWTGCGGSRECATVVVPLDYSDLDGDTVELAVNRLPATDSGDRIGSLLVNPGGPGASGVDFVEQGGSTLFAKLNESYDIVGFDPRGVGASEPVNCLDAAGVDRLMASDPDPDTPPEVARTAGLYRKFGLACQRAAGDLLPHLSTSVVARDLDVLRGVVGDERLNYLGFSYGTLVGAVYAELFPDAVGRMVLDGAVDPGLDSKEAALSQAGGFQTALEAYAADCVTKPGCPLGTDVDAGLQRIRTLLDELDAQPLPTDDPERPLTEGLALYGIAYPLYVESLWPGLTLALQGALGEMDGRQLLLLADLYADRTDSGYRNNKTQVIYAVNCLDDPSDASASDVRATLDEFEQAAPTLGRAFAWGPLACAQWPVKPAEPLPDTVDAEGAPPIVVVGTTRDPATPYAQAQALADDLESGVLLTRDGDGHTAYGQGNACITAAVEAYLLKGTVPAEGTIC